MKKEFVIFLAVLLVFVSLSSSIVKAATTSTNSCDLKVSLVNQDPYPAVQGDSVKLLFQLSGVQNPDCNGAVFRLDPGYSFSLTKNDSLRVLGGSTYTQNYKNDWNIPYTLNVNPNALDGNATLDVYYAPGQNPNTSFFSKTFNISIQNSRARFQVFTKNFDSSTNTWTLEVLNTANVNAKSLTVEIPSQKGVQIKGSNVNVIGELDANDYTTADFLAIPSTGNVTVALSYTDQANIRRTVEQNVSFDSSYFESSSSQSKGSPLVTWIVIIAILGIIVYWFYKRSKKRKALMKQTRK